MTDKNESNVDLERLAVLGQIAVLRDRLNTLESTLIRRPLGYDYVDESFVDAQGNVALQAGALVGNLTRYMDRLRK